MPAAAARPAPRMPLARPKRTAISVTSPPSAQMPPPLAAPGECWMLPSSPCVFSVPCVLGVGGGAAPLRPATSFHFIFLASLLSPHRSPLRHTRTPLPPHPPPPTGGPTPHPCLQGHLPRCCCRPQEPQACLSKALHPGCLPRGLHKAHGPARYSACCAGGRRKVSGLHSKRPAAAWPPPAHCLLAPAHRKAPRGGPKAATRASSRRWRWRWRPPSIPAPGLHPCSATPLPWCTRLWRKASGGAPILAPQGHLPIHWQQTH